MISYMRFMCLAHYICTVAHFSFKTKATVGGTPIFTDAFEPVARVTLYLTDENGLDLGSCFGAA